jgi:hypothetical protein
VQGLSFGGEIPAFLRTKKVRKQWRVYNDRHFRFFFGRFRVLTADETKAFLK